LTGDMNCDHCDKPALVHEVVIRNGKRHEVHLCEEHAKAIGYLPTGSSAPVILGHVMSAIAKPSPRGTVPVCQSCGLSLAQFRQTGLLGCADCYDAFGEPLASIIEKEQAGHCGHIGKRPKRGGGGIDVARLRQHLLRQLEEAVAAEQYERAAKLRDQLLSLKDAPPPSVASGVRPPRRTPPTGIDTGSGRGADPDGERAETPDI